MSGGQSEGRTLSEGDGLLRIRYRIHLGAGEDAADKARQISFEQTVELPPECVSEDVRTKAVGRVEAVRELGGGVAESVIEYPAELVADLPGLLHLLFGNVSMQAGVRVEAVDWPAGVLSRFGGPGFGIEGIRRLCGVTRGRALTCAALKPVGLTAEGLAALAGELAAGGIDIVKDDHSLSDQTWAPFRERVTRCQEAVSAANRETGGGTLYFPNLTGPAEELESRLEAVRRAGCRGVLVSPLVLGLDAVRRLAEVSGLVVVAHPALAGAFVRSQHGLAPGLLLGDLFRLAGCDGVIYPNVGGRFRFGLQDCEAINRALRRPLGELLPALPFPAGGIEVERVPEWVTRYGPDTAFLLGGSLYRQGDLRAAAARLARAVATI